MFESYFSCATDNEVYTVCPTEKENQDSSAEFLDTIDWFKKTSI